jgi:hypothetical protein
MIIDQWKATVFVRGKNFFSLLGEKNGTGTSGKKGTGEN